MIDRDYSTDVTITMEWGEWLDIYGLASERQLHNANDPEWPDGESERERDIVTKFGREIGDNSPGNGMDDWPESMKQAWDETVMEMIEDL